MNQVTSWLGTPWFWLGAGLGLALTLNLRQKRWGLSLLTALLFLHLCWISIGKNFFLPDWLEQPDLREPFWVRGTIHSFTSDSNSSRLQLRKATILNRTHEYDFLELAVSLPNARGRFPYWYVGRQVQLGGFLREFNWDGIQWNLHFSEALLGDASPPKNGWQRALSTLRLRWETRAAYYLNDETLAMFLPLTLAERSVRHPSLELFRKTGMAHVLAISGLHIGLLYFGLFGISRIMGTMKPNLWENQSFVAISRWLPLLLLWGYVFLLEFPIPALRAVTMITLWLLFRELGYRLPALFALWVTALLFLVVDWSVMLTVSFQLSFVAVAFLVGVSHSRIFEVHGRLKWVVDSLVITTFVSLGTFPILLNTFGRISLEVFWLNLILVPMMAIWILPVCLLGLAWSSLWLWSPPEMLGERFIFGVIEFSLEAWLNLLRWLQWEEWRFEIKGEWEPQYYVAYYAALLGLLGLGKRFGSRRLYN